MFNGHDQAVLEILRNLLTDTGPAVLSGFDGLLTEGSALVLERLFERVVAGCRAELPFLIVGLRRGCANVSVGRFKRAPCRPVCTPSLTFTSLLMPSTLLGGLTEDWDEVLVCPSPNLSATVLFSFPDAP